MGNQQYYLEHTKELCFYQIVSDAHNDQYMVREYNETENDFVAVVEIVVA